MLTQISCTKVLYTQDDIMGQYRTKQKVVDKFGLPTEKRAGEGIEEWIYNYGTVSTAAGFGNSNTRASVNGGNGYAYGNATTNSINVTQFSQYSRYVKFTFDKEGYVTKWESQGVDFTVRKASTPKTIGLIVFFIACAAAGVALAAGTN